VTPAPLDEYLGRLRDQLRQRGLDDRRILEEAHDHLG
jgi:hypothetical protein